MAQLTKKQSDNKGRRVQVSFYVSPATLLEFKTLAEVRDTDVSELARTSIQSLYNEELKEIRKELRNARVTSASA